MNKEELIQKITAKNTLNKTEKKFEQIYKERLYDFETLERRNSDSLDFHDISVWAIKDLMQRAYDLGKEDALREQNNEKTK